ncbi:MAG: ferredoxin [Acidimicrobiales bacterium]|nr:ferredoxin [Acidimicrobiales bacterium]
MTISVDRDLCQGHGVCESEAPAVFTVGEDRQVVIVDPAPPDDQRDAVKAAVKYCPTHALSLDD